MSRLDANSRRSPATAVRLSSRSDLPTRVMAHLQGVLELCRSTFPSLLNKVLDESERQIFLLAEKTTHRAPQEHELEGLSEIKRKRRDLAPIMIQMIEDSLARFDSAMAAASGPESGPAARLKPTLSLLENSDMEPSLVLKEIETRYAIRHGQQLQALGYRFGVLAAAPAFDAESLPIGPANLCSALRICCASMNLAGEHRALLYRTFDHFAMSEIEVLYRLINQYFVRHHLLRHLRITVRRPRTAIDTRAAAMAPAPANINHPNWMLGGTTPRRPVPIPEPETVEPDIPMAPDVANVTLAPVSNLPTSNAEADLLASLREAFFARRAAHPALARIDSKPVLFVSLDDLCATLHTLLLAHANGITGGTSGIYRTADRIPTTADEILHELQKESRKLDPFAPLPQLAPAHADTIELIELLMQQIKQALPRDARFLELIDQMHMPMLRIALSDEKFFTQREHPARQLLNTLIDASLKWRDENAVDADPVFAERNQWVLHRLKTAAEITPEILTELNDDITRHLQTLERKTEIAEQRAIDASRGHERIVSARRVATTAIAERIAHRTPPAKLLLAILEQQWTDALTLTLLRQGEESEEYARHLIIAESLLASSMPGASPLPANMRREFEAGLSQVGMYAEDIQTISSHLFAHKDTHTVGVNETPSATALTERLVSAVRPIKKNVATVRDSVTSKAASAPLDAIERQILSYLKTLPFGTWFDFATTKHGDSVLRKLAWYSAASGTCLFVNARGVRACERSFEQVARDMAHDKIRLFRSQHESPIDRASKSVLNTLPQLDGSKTARSDI